MHSVNEEGQLCVNLDDFNQLSESIRFRAKIDYLTTILNCPKEVSNFSIAILFKSGKRYYISNLYLWAIPYHTEGFYRANANHDISFYDGKEFFIQRHIKYDFIQQIIVNALELRYKLHATFAMVRQCYELDLIMEAYNTQRVSDPEKLYFQIRAQFEKFIIDFFQEMQVEIASALPQHQYLNFFQNSEFRKRIITRQLNKLKPNLTERELECLHYIAQGMGSKVVANKLNLSIETVNSHAKSIRRKLGCSNIVHAVAIAVRHDLFSCKISPNLGI